MANEGGSTLQDMAIKGKYSLAGFRSRIWMANHFYTLGDFQPDTGQVHLPPMDRKDIHKEMSHELTDEAVSLPSFYRIWDLEFKDVKVPPQQRFGKCPECEDKHKKILAEKDKDEVKKLKEKRRAHVQNVIADRKVYHQWRVRCRDEPDKYMCVIVDGMDQAKTNLPSFNTGESPFQMTVRVVGALIHRKEKKAYAYLVTNFTKETNTMTEVITRVLDTQ